MVLFIWQHRSFLPVSKTMLEEITFPDTLETAHHCCSVESCLWKSPVTVMSPTLTISYPEHRWAVVFEVTPETGEESVLINIERLVLLTIFTIVCNMPKVLHLSDECCHFNNNRSFYTNTNKGAAVARRSSRRPTTNQSRWFKHPWAGYWARAVPDASITVRMLDRKHLSKKRVDGWMRLRCIKRTECSGAVAKGCVRTAPLLTAHLLQWERGAGLTLGSVTAMCQDMSGVTPSSRYMYKLGTSEMKAGPEVQHLQRVN